MYNHTLHSGRKHFCCYCLQAFRTAGKLKCYIKDCFKINGNQITGMPKKGEYPNESLTNKYQKNVACSYHFKLVCNDNKFRKPFKSYLSEGAVYNFIGNLIERSKYCSENHILFR